MIGFKVWKVYCKGNNGGVHVDSTDLIGLQIGFLLDQSNGQGSIVKFSYADD